MDAVTFLIKEHDYIRKHLAQISKKPKASAAKKAMFKNLCHYLVRHETMEEKVWYPYLKADQRFRVRLKHLIKEENMAAKEIKKFKKIKTAAEWEKEFNDLKKAVLHHAKEEETKLFPAAEKFCDHPDLVKLCKEMRTFKKNFKKKKL